MILGILGGMGPLATAKFYEKLILMTGAKTDQENIHTIIDSNVKVPDRTSFIMGVGEDPLPALLESIQRLTDAGADVIAIPCNTAHFFYEDMHGKSNIPILNMIELATKNLDSPTLLLATEGTYESDLYRKYEGGNLLVYPKKSDRKIIMKWIYELKEGNVNVSREDIFSAVTGMLKEAGLPENAEILLGCTELPIIFDSLKMGEKLNLRYAGVEMIKEILRLNGSL